MAACGMQGVATGDIPVPPRPADAVRLASLNVQFIDPDRSAGLRSLSDWDCRKTSLDAAFKAIDADIFAFQEAGTFPCHTQTETNPMLDWLLTQNTDYRAGGHGQPQTFPATQPILYHAGRLTLLDQGWFFFSDTPDVIYSRGFDGSYPSYATWAQFRSGTETLRIVNVHLDVTSRSNRRASATLVADRIAPWLDAGERVVVMGDMNTFATSPTIPTMADAGLTFVETAGATFHFRSGSNLYGPIDHLGLSDGITPLGGTFVVRRQFEGGWPSDHYPVLLDVELDALPAPAGPMSGAG